MKNLLRSTSLRLGKTIERHLTALTFRDQDRTLTRIETIPVLALHLAGLAAFWRLLQQPIWFALPTLAFLLALPMFIGWRARRALAVETLAPLFFLYLIIAARFVYVRIFDGAVPGYFDYNAPDLRSSLFRLEPWVACSLIYTLAIQVRYLAGRGWQRILSLGTTAFALVTFVWASALYIGQRTHGVAGTDPYAYAQMGVDLALRGTPLHHFALFPSVAPLNIAWSPVMHLGYHIPINSSGDAPTVWPVGGSFAFALAYRLTGEQGLYLVNPLTSLLLLVATGWLAWELFHDSEYRVWIATLSIAILATSHTLFDWATVPMVDSQAALFSVLAIGSAIRFARQPRLGLAMLSGLALGTAYFVRHTQVLIVPAIGVLLWMNRAPRGLRVRALIFAGLASLLVALPDLWYHQTVFGGWLIPESRESNLFSIAAMGDTISTLGAGLLAAREFGWLLPFLLYGAYRLVRDRLVVSVAFAQWLLVLVGFHLLYPALRLRDLLPEFPPLAIIAAYGVVALVSAVRSNARGWRKLASASGLIATLFLLLMRVWNVLPIPFGEPQSSYGYLTAVQRAAFDQIAALTPADAVIGSTPNDGAIDLYAHRATFRPGDWNSAECATFVDAMLRAKREVFLLDDSAATSDARRDLAAQYMLRQIGVLDVPVFSIADGTPGALWEITTQPK